MNTVVDRTKLVEDKFLNKLAKGALPEPASAERYNGLYNKEIILDIFRSQVESRLLDLVARNLKLKNKGFYTIGSSGHEGMAAVSQGVGIKNTAFLHYRDCAFVLQRARQKYRDSKLEDHLRALVASINDPIASGRHKVLGSKALNVPPQTSTIASHGPRALGCAYSIGLAKKLNLSPKGEFAICSFGDGSFNHSTLQGSLNSAAWLSQQGIPVPLLFICEDNGIAISVPTDEIWIKSSMYARHGYKYFECDGLNVFDTLHTARAAKEYIISNKKPAFLRVKTTRLFGHAGSDVEMHYLSEEQILANESKDPLLYSSYLINELGLLTYGDIIDLYESTKSELIFKAEDIVNEPKLDSKEEIMRSIVPYSYENRKLGNIDAANINKPLTLAQSLNKVLSESLQRCKELVIFGEDVGRKGGVYRVTADLQSKFGRHRVFDTLLDEQTIIGSALGMSMHGILPVCEIQFLAYIFNAIDQLRGEAATQSFFSSSQFTNPMIIRVPGLAYQKGFGGHFHNDNGVAALCDIPGVIVACPATPRAAVKMFRSCLKLAYEQHRVVVFLEPIALYHTKDYVLGDKKFLEHYPTEGEHDLGNVIVDSGKDINVITFGNGFYLSKQAKQILAQKGIDINIIDLCYLSPLPTEAIVKSLIENKPILIVDETRRTKSISETIITGLIENNVDSSMISRITGEDSFIPLGKSWEHVVPKSTDIVEKVEKILN